MKQSRRDLLKYFAAGATIIPVLGGTPMPDIPAKLIKEPKIDLVPPDNYILDVKEADLDDMYQIKNGARGHIQVEITTAEGAKFKLSGATDFFIDYTSPQPTFREPYLRNGFKHERSGFVDTARREMLNIPPVVKWDLRGIFVRSDFKL